MKKKVYIFLLLFVLLFPIKMTYAYKLSLTGSDRIDKTEEYVLKLTDLEDNDFYGFTAVLEYDKAKLELLEIIGLNDLNLTYSAKTNKMLLYTTNGITDNKDLIKLKFKNIGLKNNEDVVVSFDNINATNSKEDIKVEKVSIKINAKSNGIKSNNDLEKIKINGKDLELENGQLNYEIVVSNDTKKINLKAFAEDNNATVVGNGTYDLQEGSNQIRIEVKDKDGEVKTYTVDVNRESKDAKIAPEDLFIKRKAFNWLNIIPLLVIFLVIIFIIWGKKFKR